MQSFVEHFVEQDFPAFLGWATAIVLAVVSVPLAAVTVVAARRGGWKSARAFLLSSGLSLGAFVVVLTFFEAAALYLRYQPHGSGTERHATDYARFFDQAEVAFVLTYAAILLLSVLIGYGVGRWLASSGPRVAAVTFALMLGLMTVTLPMAEFANACNVGRPFVLDSRC